MRVLIADDHAVVRQGLRHILASIPELNEIGETSDGEETLSRVRAEPWDVLVLDISMPGESGLALEGSALLMYELEPGVHLGVGPVVRQTAAGNFVGVDLLLTK